MQLFPGMWFSHAGQLESVELVVQPSPVSSQARVQILRPYCNPNHHLVPPGTVQQLLTYLLLGFSESFCLFDAVGNNLLFAPQAAALSLIHSRAAQRYLCVTPQGAAAWASTGATCWRPVCPPPVPAAPMTLQQKAVALPYRPDTLQYHPSTTWWLTCL